MSGPILCRSHALKGWCLLMQKYFPLFMSMREKQISEKATDFNPERKLGIAGHFVEIIKQQLF